MREVIAGQTDFSVFVFVPDAAQTDGSGKTGLVAANLTISYSRMETDNDATVTDATSSINNLASLTAAHADWGWYEVSSTLAPGLYRLDIADAVFATGAWESIVYVMITTSAASPAPLRFILIEGTTSPLASIKAKTDLIPGTMDGKTFAEHILLQSAVLFGKASGLDTTTAVFRAIDDSQDRVTATVTADGNRTAVTVDTTSP